MLKRLQWVDFSKGIVIILVVVAHVMHRGTFEIAFIYTFHMPFFFVMAGYLLNVAKYEKRYNDFVNKSFKRLVFPYFLANFLYYPVWYIFCHLMGRLAIYDWAYRAPLDVLRNIFIGNIPAVNIWLVLHPLWFLMCLFFAEILYLKLCIGFKEKTTKIFGAVCILSVAGYILGAHLPLPLGIDIALVAQFFIFVGNFIKKNNLLEKMNFGSCVIFLAMVFAITYLNGKITMDGREYGNLILLYIGGIVGSLFVMKISMAAADIGNKISDFISYCGKQSMIILVLHIPIIAVTYNLTLAINPKYAELGLRFLPIGVETFIIAVAVIFPVIIAKKFGDKSIVKYFCV